MPIEKEPLRRFFRCGEDSPLEKQINKATSAVARRSPHIASHDLHEVEGHTEKDVLPKKDMCEFGRMNIQRIDSHTTRCTGQPPTVPLHPVIPCFLGMGLQERSFLPSCGIKKIPHMWYKNEHRGIKRYHICDTFCRCE